MSECKVRRMTVEDLDAVTTIEAATFAMPWSRKSFEQELTRNVAARYLVAELDDAVLMFDQRAAREKIEIRYEEPEDFIIVMGDHNRLKQVFVNILDNAFKHTPSGGAVSISVRRIGEEATVTIADTGEGIKPEDLPQVKTKFYKGDSTKRGSGIGLAVADEIVTRHGGRLEIGSIYQKGTTVTITLPLAGKKSEAEISEIEG